MKTEPLVLGFLLVISSAILGAGCHRAERSLSAANAARYQCPMHPTYTSAVPGDCPICNMKLVPIGVGDTAASGPTIAGRTTIMVSPEKQQLVGVRTATVFPRALTHTLRAPGIVEHDETALARIAPRFGGWVRTLYVNYTGQEVRQGQPLLTVYSPELLATENEYLLAWRQSQPAQGRPPTEVRDMAPLLEAARRRLQLWEIGEEEIRALETNGQASDELLLRAPISGHVIAKSAVAGKAFMAGETLYEIGILDRLWVRATVSESDLPQVRVGQNARVVFPHLAGQTRETKVSFVSPHLLPDTRRGEIRLELENPHHDLRPEMWANVEIDMDLGEVLSVPASAILDTGTRCLAFVQREDHHLEPREVKVGIRTDEWWQVLEGLKQGEKVVTRALFLIDAESQLKAVVAGMASPAEPLPADGSTGARSGGAETRADPEAPGN